jgi:hypothetical protein
MVDAPSKPAGTPDTAEILRLGAQEAARQASLLRVPDASHHAGRPIADPVPRDAGRAA